MGVGGYLILGLFSRDYGIFLPWPSLMNTCMLKRQSTYIVHVAYLDENAICWKCIITLELSNIPHH